MPVEKEGEYSMSLKGIFDTEEQKNDFKARLAECACLFPEKCALDFKENIQEDR